MTQQLARRMKRLLVQARLHVLVASVLLALLSGAFSACRSAAPTPTPARAPTMTPMPTFTQRPSRTPIPDESPTPPAAPPTATRVPPTATRPAPIVTPTAPVAPTATATTAATATRVPPTPTPQPIPPLPRQGGGDWDMESSFYEWQSPFEEFTGHVANGWSPLIKAYAPPAAPRFNENKFPPNIHSGQRSQEISFDFRSGEMGLWRTIDVIAGHQYRIEAWAKYAPSPSGLNLFLGIDLSGGGQFEAASVTWNPWQTATPNEWIATRQTVRAASARMTIFLRAVHAIAEPGGNTMFDNVSVEDAGG